MNSYISWIGGKKSLRKKILEQFPNSEEYDRYIEVFGGAGWILFSKERHAAMEVFNDINGELINLYRCIKYHCEA
ncbi:DNA methylase, partial [Lachnotalea glycerini]